MASSSEHKPHSELGTTITVPVDALRRELAVLIEQRDRLQEELQRIADDPARALSLRERGIV